MDAIRLGGNVEVTLTGRTLTVYDYDAGRERDYAWSVVLDSVQTGAILGELLSDGGLITPDSLVGGWLQQAFNSGLGVGRAEAEFEPRGAGFDWLADLPDDDIAELGGAVLAQMQTRNDAIKEATA